MRPARKGRRPVAIGTGTASGPLVRDAEVEWLGSGYGAFDAQGNIWCTGPGGIWVVAPDGSHLATLELPRVPVTNFCFGGPDLRTIFFTTFTELGRVRVAVPGLDPGRPVTPAAGPAWTAEGRVG
jgi:hypothetical protein